MLWHGEFHEYLSELVICATFSNGRLKHFKRNIYKINWFEYDLWSKAINLHSLLYLYWSNIIYFSFSVHVETISPHKGKHLITYWQSGTGVMRKSLPQNHPQRTNITKFHLHTDNKTRLLLVVLICVYIIRHTQNIIL